MTPYYDDGQCVIYHGDCREVDAWDIAGAVMVTDPPYGYDHASNWPGKFQGESIANDSDEVLRDEVLHLWAGRPAIIFGSLKSTRPPGTRCTLVWDKGPASGMGDLSIPWKPSFELVFVVGVGFVGSRSEGVLKGHHVVTWSGEGQRKHPNEKPVDLLRALLLKCPPLADVVDPFMGSGTTLRAAKDLGRKAIGIEIEERYCEIAANRLAQGVLDFGGAA